MREWSHSELHTIINSSKTIKEFSDRVHAQTEPDTWEVMIQQKKQNTPYLTKQTS